MAFISTCAPFSSPCRPPTVPPKPRPSSTTPSCLAHLVVPFLLPFAQSPTFSSSLFFFFFNLIIVVAFHRVRRILDGYFDNYFDEERRFVYNFHSKFVRKKLMMFDLNFKINRVAGEKGEERERDRFWFVEWIKANLKLYKFHARFGD